MTMIARTENFGAPIIIADLLISQEERPNHFILPSVADDIMQYLKEEYKYHPILLLRKTYLPSSNVCIAFAGKKWAIERFYNDFSIFCRLFEKVKIKDIEKFIQEYDFSETPANVLSWQLFVIEEENEGNLIAHSVRGSGVQNNTPIFGSVLAIGSGSIDFLEEVSEIGNLSTSFSPGTLDYAIQTNIILIAKILSKERATLHTVKRFWGAGFEMIYPTNGRFNQIDDICYIINQGTLDEDGEIEVPIPVVILRYKYQGEILVITAIAPENGSTEINEQEIIIRYNSFNITQFVVKPVDYPEEIDLTQFSKDTSFYCHRNAMGYIIETPKGKYIPASFHVGHEISIDHKHSDSVTITMKREINDMIVQASKEILMQQNTTNHH